LVDDDRDIFLEIVAYNLKSAEGYEGFYCEEWCGMGVSKAKRKKATL